MSLTLAFYLAAMALLGMLISTTLIGIKLVLDRIEGLLMIIGAELHHLRTGDMPVGVRLAKIVASAEAWDKIQGHIKTHHRRPN